MEQNKSIYYGKSIVKKIVQTGVLLALAIVVNITCSSFMKFPLAPFLKFDFALVVVTFSALAIAPWSALVLILLLAIIGPAYGSNGYDPIGLLGHFLLALTQLTFVLTFYFLYKFFNKTIYQNSIRKQIDFYIAELSLAAVITTLFLTFVNVFITTPWYFKAFGALKNEPATINSMIKNWDKFKGLFLNINNYYLGTSTIFALFNIINLSLNALIIFIFLAFNIKAKLWKSDLLEINKKKHFKNIFIQACYAKLNDNHK
ncbi:MPN527 family putative ECF transporter permease subunit [Mycoplasmopsis fermentans]|uniref:ECF transporter S component n=1 Tax=Mycoplasmopsis fermentans (strain M64) TaxID=943945 RepID=A0AB32XBJ1_MYCFM|nr:hypothetical protein [Mycoplasmopsis fermentans]ADN68972.1 conserved hypothetical membrane spanning protein [Mycoplasmopsis fermentans JER]ADV34406.1 Conserved Hypothetical Protein [Mycoplasmopsis fermentans M64]RMX35667.1 hypothetical protein MFI1_0359 [Mycoplasmopsis fermentans MF-I1]RMX35678.1 hypothetical protein MFI2_0352 [Mycoplasmopsis fermentans MF-I2]